ncbi:uncharacterized protein LOC125177718 [Hyalella azteca]|uniref:Uncharacterized protein LOC125177718 n=1 Tax=Hyalella azteca TaxID=294128 RepID=A0A979FGA3_HYAAZ|nr:uncharacterized protein LOC125177718 [Hyalella azteca]
MNKGRGMFFSNVICLVSLSSSFSAVQASTMTLFTDVKIAQAWTTSYLEAPSACVCRNRCFVDTRCLAVSITQAASVSKCYFSSSASVLTNLLITDSAFITFIKNKGVCRNRCFVDTRCLAVSITQEASVSKCYFSSSASVLTNLLITDSAFITFTKQKFYN